MDENDLLFTNTFVPTPQLAGEVSSESNDEFKKYYESEMEKSLERISLRSIHLDEDTDANSIMNTNKFSVGDGAGVGVSAPKRYKREVKTYVSVDSRDRNKVLYPNPSQFSIFLGKTFYNVKTVKLASMEFPNTNAVINSTNNLIYWRNQQDIDLDVIDSITKTYPVYSVSLRIGSYIATTLQSEIASKLNSVKRANKLGDFHYFDVTLDLDTDIVTFTSLILKQTPNNALSVTAGTGIVNVNSPNHGYYTGQTIYLVGGTNIGGITSLVLNAPHKITVLNSDNFQFEVNIKAGNTVIGGGSNVKTGKLAPFQLLFGHQTHTVAPNIGFPLENSAQRIDTYIQSIQNLYMVDITLATPHGFLTTFDFIGKPCTISASGTSPSIDGVRVITKIVDTNTFTVITNSKIDYFVLSSGTVTFGAKTYSINSIKNHTVDTVLVTTFTPHDYALDDVGKSVTFYNTVTTPTFNSSNLIYGLLGPQQIIIPGSVLPGGDSNTNSIGSGGSMPRHEPLKTFTFQITNVVTGAFTTLTCPNHGLMVGDRIQINNVTTIPSIVANNNGVYAIVSVPDNNTLIVNFATTSVDLTTVNNGNAYIGSNIIKASFPYHGFNNIIGITNGVDPGTVLITTTLPHHLATGQLIRVMQTDCTPSIDGGGYEVTVISPDSFEIPYPPGLSTPGTSGILGMSNKFLLYGVTGFGGISSEAFNNNEFTVKDILDQHSFTFEISEFATSGDIGGGTDVYVSSLLHGFNGIQDNTKNSLLNRSINLQGENYAFLCCPQLSTMMNTGSVKNVFARITLDQSPGSMVFSFLSNPKEFDTVPLDTLSELDFSVVNWDGTLYDFNNIDFSMTFEITEVVDTTDTFNVSSRRGIVNN